MFGPKKRGQKGGFDPPSWPLCQSNYEVATLLSMNVVRPDFLLERTK
jgi:hypothetical protein